MGEGYCCGGFGGFEGTARGFSWVWRVVLFVQVGFDGGVLSRVKIEWVGGVLSRVKFDWVGGGKWRGVRSCWWIFM